MKLLVVVVCFLAAASQVSGRKWYGNDLLKIGKIGRELQASLKDEEVMVRFMETVTVIAQQIKYVVLEVTGTVLKTPNDFVKPLLSTARHLVKFLTTGISHEAFGTLKESLQKLKELLFRFIGHVKHSDGISAYVKDALDTAKVITDLQRKHGAELRPILFRIVRETVDLLRHYRQTLSGRVTNFSGILNEAFSKIDKAILSFIRSLHGQLRTDLRQAYEQVKPTAAQYLRILIASLNVNSTK